MPNHASLLEQKQASKQAYSRHYYLKHKERYIINYEKKRQATYTCVTCDKTLQLVSKDAHEKTRKHLYAYYSSGEFATGGSRSAQSAEREGESELREEQVEDQSEGSSAEEQPGAI
jgi:ribosomal protein L34E